MGKTFCGYQFRKMFFASVLTTFIMNLNFIADKILATQLLGKNAMAGIEIVLPLLYVTAFLELMISTGTAYLYSFEIGAFQSERANRLVGQGVIWTLFLSVVLTTSLLWGEDAYFSFFANAEAMTAFAREYYEPFLAVIAIHPLYILMQMLAYADGGGRYCVAATAAQIVVHIVLAVLGVAYWGLGMTGIALAVFISELVAMAIFARWTFIVSRTLKLVFHISLTDTIHMLKLSYVNASLSLYIAIGNILLIMYFINNFGQENFPIMSAAISIFQLAVCFSGVEKATEPIANIYLGEKNFDGVIKVMKPAIVVAFGFGVSVIPFMWLFSAPIAGIFGIADTELMAESDKAIKIISFAMPFVSLLYLFTTYYQISGYFKTALSLSFCKDLLIYVGCPILFSLFIDMQGIWFGMMSVPIITIFLFSVILFFRYPNSFPLLVPKKDIVSKDYALDNHNVIKLRDWAEEEFSNRGFTSKYALKVGLLVEEIGMIIVEKNPCMNVLAELTLFFEEEPKLILRDNGRSFDMTQDNLGSFRDFFLYNFLTSENINSKFLETQNYNRHVFRLLTNESSREDMK